MGAETTSFVDSLAELFGLLRVQCADCQHLFFAPPVNWVQQGGEEVPEFKAKCPVCKSKDITLAPGE